MNPILVGAGGFCVLGIWCVGAGGPAMERDIEARVESALLAAGAPVRSVEVRGREVTLAGISDDHISDARSTATGVWGVRSVTLVARGPAGTALIVVEGREGVVNVTGHVENPGLERRIREEAARAFQGRQVRIEIEITGDGAPPVSWPSTFVPLFTVAGRAIGDLVLTIDESVLSIQGKVGTARAVDSLGAQFIGAAPGVDLHNGLKPAEGLEQRIAAAVSGRRIEFETGSSRLSRSGRLVLDAVGRALASATTTRVRVEGHTDSSGPAEANLQLSQARAEAVSRYLSNRGIAVDRLTASGIGAGRPIADNETEEGRRKNRRIEFKVEGN